MVKYSYLRLFADSTGIYLRSPDENIEKRILQEVTKLISGFKTERFANGDFRIHQLNYKDYEIGKKILLLLLQEGWEPFSIEYDNREASTDLKRHIGDAAYHLRLKVE